MLREILYRVLSSVLFSVVVTVVDRRLMPLGVSDKAHSLVGLAIGLLLVFRTNAGYDRFWEGRKLWGAIVNESRNLGRLASVLLAEDPALLRRVLGCGTAFAWATLRALRKGLDPSPLPGLPPEDTDVAEAGHVPLALARRLSLHFDEARRRGLISDYQQMTLDQNVQLLIDYLGGCERILKTPLPFAYVVHLRRTLVIYCFSLPFALLPSFGWGTMAVTLGVAYVLFGIEEIGVEISDPFGTDDNDLPLEDICATIQRDLTALAPVR
jgi:putative membrane protein